MKKLIFLILFPLSIQGSIAQTIFFPDENFKAALLAHSPTIDLNDNKEIEFSEAKEVTTLTIFWKSIYDLTGIEAFTSLKSLFCHYNYLTSLDLSHNLDLTELHCYTNQLESLNVSKNTALTTLYCGSNKLKTLDLSKNTALKNLDCNFNQLNTLDVTNNIHLDVFVCYNNGLASLDVSKNTALTTLKCASNPIGSLDVSKNLNLSILSCSINGLETLDVHNNVNLTELYCSYNSISELNLTKNTKLTSLQCDQNPLLKSICIHENHLEYIQPNPGTFIKDNSAVWNSQCNTIASLNIEPTLYANKKLLRILTLHGTVVDSDHIPNGIYIYQYSDGSSQKRLVLEDASH